MNTYSTPELVVIGSAHSLVLGVPGATLDNFISETSHPMVGVTLGLDD
jgi:hypothetical protein